MGSQLLEVVPWAKPQALGHEVLVVFVVEGVLPHLLIDDSSLFQDLDCFREEVFVLEQVE